MARTGLTCSASDRVTRPCWKSSPHA